MNQIELAIKHGDLPSFSMFGDEHIKNNQLNIDVNRCGVSMGFDPCPTGKWSSDKLIDR